MKSKFTTSCVITAGKRVKLFHKVKTMRKGMNKHFLEWKYDRLRYRIGVIQQLLYPRMIKNPPRTIEPTKNDENFDYWFKFKIPDVSITEIQNICNRLMKMHGPGINKEGHTLGAYLGDGIHGGQDIRALQIAILLKELIESRQKSGKT
jgi:hypothetical protein